MRTAIRRMGCLGLILVAGSCVSANREAVDAPAAKLLPDRVAELVPPGWRLYGQVEQFTPENLYEPINGRAEFYLAYDVVSLTFATFENASDPLQSAELSIFDMGTPTHAFGVFSAERLGGEAPLPFGRAAYHSGASVYAWTGQYYVQAIATSASGDLEPITKALAREAVEMLPDSGESVWGLSALPAADRLPDSVRYFQVDALGLDFMQHTYTAQYLSGGEVIAAFVSLRDSETAAQATVDAYAEYAGKYGKGVERVSVDGRELLVCNMGAVFDVVFGKGRLVGGVTSVQARAQAIQASTKLYEQLRKE
ncbi:MAG: hypothetical protein GWP08_03850 [Nitrospiraceae bacterium]|nr:hypothetical protein [Nitrospiraceae bacterium]